MALFKFRVYFEHGSPLSIIALLSVPESLALESPGGSKKMRRIGSRAHQEPDIVHVSSTDSVLNPWPDSSLESGEETTNAKDRQNAAAIVSDRPTEVNETHHPILFREDFKLDQSYNSARLYITALGLYDARINGKRVGHHVLTLGWQTYIHRHEYNTYDVTDLL
ncbi:uncharacterized protein ATNIH1004_009029 [Aspergillus tanneri]|uniref:Bacterial alpha-L-rhamnosidase N-terminal domain-containing protein n=1 Tax=Aspergillus tanneri TaxID=1220188 RepID=A0A5M9MD07_9EURO|nr:uncharacterized protein ATNIH1004_009029 [Aspergillus tanneri]KAA8644821.1 hypothetical protein ATNIH1004_009029 [Aspergillus tanneri]